MNAKRNEMTEAELAAWQYAHRDVLDSDEGEEVDVDIAPQLSVTISFRLPGAEADAIREAASEAGLSLSEWIRQACADALAPVEPAGGRRAVQSELRVATRELQAIARRLDAAAHEQAAAAARDAREQASGAQASRRASTKGSRRT